MNSSEFLAWLESKNQSAKSAHRLERPLIMGILNITSDSFFDGGCYLSLDKAYDKAMKFIAQGVDLIDIGGESTRPGAEEIAVGLELDRVVPIIEKIRSASDVCLSIDTSKPEVMEAAVTAGANCINDVFALRRDGALFMAARLRTPVCLMHMQGTPKTMQQNPSYSDGVVIEVKNFFSERIKACQAAGIHINQLIIDPGFGFGKSLKDNMRIMRGLDCFYEMKRPILLGVSRKNSIGAILAKEASKRLIGGIALSVYAALKGVAILRTHDVAQTYQALRVIEEVFKADECY